MVLSVLVKREIKALFKNPAFILSMILLVVFYAALGNITGSATQSAARAVSEMSVCVVVEDRSRLVEELLRLLNETTGGRVYTCDSLADAVEKRGLGIVIPSGFTENATSPSKQLFLEGAVRLDSLSPIDSQARVSLLSTLTGLIERLLPLAVSSIYNITIQPEKNIMINGSVFVYGREISITTFMTVAPFASFLPMLIGIVLGTNAMYASQFIAMEKTEKAFEMLLAQPVRRRDIVIAKIIGASVTSIVFSVVYLVSILIMISSTTPTPQTSPATTQETSYTTSLDLMIRFFGYGFLGVLGLTLVIGLIVSGALGVVLGSIVSDERIAGSITTPVIFVFMGVGFFIAFIGMPLNMLSSILAGLLVLPLPYVYVLSVLTENPALILYSITTSIITCALLIYVAVKIFDRDIIVVGLRIGGFKRRETI